MNKIVSTLFALVAPFQSNYLAQCGHLTKKFGVVEFENKQWVQVLDLDDRQPEYCIECLAQMTIHCANCGGLIRIGDLVCLQTGPTRKIQSHATWLGSEAVCCTGFDCCDMGVDSADGRWSPPGRVRAVNISMVTSDHVVTRRRDPFNR